MSLKLIAQLCVLSTVGVALFIRAGQYSYMIFFIMTFCVLFISLYNSMTPLLV